MKIVSLKICPFVQRVTAALETRNIKYDIEYITLKDKPEWFLEVSPNGQVPIMITENREVLFESDAIIEYVNDEYGWLKKDINNIDKSKERAWSYLATKNYMNQCSLMRSKDFETFNDKISKFNKDLKKIEDKLNSNFLFFSGSFVSHVDISWLPILHRFSIIEKYTGYDFFKDFSKIKKWRDEILKLDIVKNSVSQDFEEIFVNFYINNNYLSNYKK